MDGFQCGIHVNNTTFCDGIGLTLVEFSMKRAYKGKEGKRFKLICIFRTIDVVRLVRSSGREPS